MLNLNKILLLLFNYTLNNYFHKFIKCLKKDKAIIKKNLKLNKIKVKV